MRYRIIIGMLLTVAPVFPAEWDNNVNCPVQYCGEEGHTNQFIRCRKDGKHSYFIAVTSLGCSELDESGGEDSLNGLGIRAFPSCELTERLKKDGCGPSEREFTVIRIETEDVVDLPVKLEMPWQVGRGHISIEGQLQPGERPGPPQYERPFVLQSDSLSVKPRSLTLDAGPSDGSDEISKLTLEVDGLQLFSGSVEWNFTVEDSNQARVEIDRVESRTRESPVEFSRRGLGYLIKLPFNRFSRRIEDLVFHIRGLDEPISVRVLIEPPVGIVTKIQTSITIQIALGFTFFAGLFLILMRKHILILTRKISGKSTHEKHPEPQQQIESPEWSVLTRPGRVALTPIRLHPSEMSDENGWPIRVRCPGGENDVIRFLVDISTEARTPRVNVAVVIDTSDSMLEERLGHVKGGVREFIERLPAGSYFSAIGFGSRSYDIVSPVKVSPISRIDAIDRVNKIETGGSSNISRGIMRGLESLQECRSECDLNVLILITDGVPDEGSGHILDEAIHLAQEQSVQISTLGIGEQAAPEVLEPISAATRGRSYAVDDGEAVGPTLGKELVLLIDTWYDRLNLRFVPEGKKSIKTRTFSLPTRTGKMRSNESGKLVAQVEPADEVRDGELLGHLEFSCRIVGARVPGSRQVRHWAWNVAADVGEDEILADDPRHEEDLAEATRLEVDFHHARAIRLLLKNMRDVDAIRLLSDLRRDVRGLLKVSFGKLEVWLGSKLRELDSLRDMVGKHKKFQRIDGGLREELRQILADLESFWSRRGARQRHEVQHHNEAEDHPRRRPEPPAPAAPPAVDRPPYKQAQDAGEWTDPEDDEVHSGSW